MTSTVHRVTPVPAVKPMVFSHATAEEPRTRTTTGEQSHHDLFSARTPARTDQPQR